MGKAGEQFKGSRLPSAATDLLRLAALDFGVGELWPLLRVDTTAPWPGGFGQEFRQPDTVARGDGSDSHTRTTLAGTVRGSNCIVVCS